MVSVSCNLFQKSLKIADWTSLGVGVCFLYVFFMVMLVCVCVCVRPQVQEPQSDRQLIETSPVLQKLTTFEDSIGVLFTHVRLLARAFTLRTVGFNHLTL